MEDFVIVVYCFVDDSLKELQKRPGFRLRTRGFGPKLSDGEVITMLIVGEFLGLEHDTGIWSYFHSTESWKSWFPALGCRTTFARQAANIWRITQQMHQRLVKSLGANTDDIHIVDGLPMIVANINRAKQSKLFRGLATIGYCPAKKLYFYGFHGHVLISFTGVITACTVTPANASERESCWELADNLPPGLWLGDKGYIGLYFKQLLHEEKGVHLWTPLRDNMVSQAPEDSVEARKILMPIRRRVETVIGQLCDRMKFERVRARDLWHLTSRVSRKILAHTVAVWVARLRELPDLHHSEIIAV
jgi:hypothetical protein